MARGGKFLFFALVAPSRFFDAKNKKKKLFLPSFVMLLFWRSSRYNYPVDFLCYTFFSTTFLCRSIKSSAKLHVT